MKKEFVKRLVIPGVVTVVLFAASIVYTALFNGGRFIAPMDFSAYVYRPGDLPVLLAGGLLALYVLYLAAAILWAAFAARKAPRDLAHTRRLNPKLGFLGLLGFLGFLGFWTYEFDKSVFPFIFFLFFGFFGFFYEGKMSGTLIDERFKENQVKARLVSNRVTLGIIFLATILLGQGRLVHNLEYAFIAYIITVSLSIGLGLFLGEYLLYRYDHDDQADESGE